ncbi:hypothetical protein FOL47_006435 [Perkinsus chesapeaki]|uniref:K Homology domain-containing protein n=1 Tax=Perkinsus chesapeaki TaxID=330153 RepID=A0A7J6MXC7_PERCH|nr:hypothetical protein FOL47_006435 [Perkinsus chesapeaki]
MAEASVQEGVDSGMRDRMLAALYENDALHYIIQLFWDALDAREGSIGEEEYVKLNVRLQKCLLVDFELDEAVESARGDWMEEMLPNITEGHHKQQSTKTAILLSIFTALVEYPGLAAFLFELCTLWCPSSPSLNDYLFFLTSVYLCVTEARGRIGASLATSLDDVNVLPPTFFTLLATDTSGGARQAALDGDLERWLCYLEDHRALQEAVLMTQRKAFAVTNDARAVWIFGTADQHKSSDAIVMGYTARGREAGPGSGSGLLRGQMRGAPALLYGSSMVDIMPPKRHCSIINIPLDHSLGVAFEKVTPAGQVPPSKLTALGAPRKERSSTKRAPSVKVLGNDAFNLTGIHAASAAYTSIYCPRGGCHVHGPYDVLEGYYGKLAAANKRGLDDPEALLRRFAEGRRARSRRRGFGLSRLKLPRAVIDEIKCRGGPPGPMDHPTDPMWSTMNARLRRLLRVGRRRLRRQKRRMNRAKRGEDGLDDNKARGRLSAKDRSLLSSTVCRSVDRRRNNKSSSTAAVGVAPEPSASGSILAKEPPAAVAMSPAATTAGADSPIEPKSPIDTIDSPVPVVSSSAARRRRRRRRARQEAAEEEEEEPKPVELTKSQLKRKKRLQRKAEADQDEPKPIKADPSLFQPVPDFSSKAMMDALFTATSRQRLAQIEWAEFQSLANSLDQQLEDIRAELPPRPRDKRQTTQRLQQQIYELTQLSPSEEVNGMLESAQSELVPTAAHEMFRNLQHRVALVKKEFGERQKEESDKKKQQREVAIESRRAARLGKMLRREVKDLFEAELPMISTGFEDGVQARLIGLLFPPEDQPTVLPRVEKSTEALLEPLHGETGLVRGVRIAAASEDALASAVQHLKAVDVNKVARVPIPTDVPGARRRAGDAVRKLESADQSLYITFGNNEIVVNGPSKGSVVDEAAEQIKDAMKSVDRTSQNSVTKDVSLDSETLRCVMGDSAMGLRKIQAQTGCFLHARFNNQKATVTIRGPSDAKVAEAAKALSTAAKEVTRIEVAVPSEEQQQKLFSSNGLLAPRFATIKRENRGGCRFVKDSSNRKVTVLSQDHEEAEKAAKEVRELVEEASMNFETVAVPSNQVNVWMRSANVELLRIKNELGRVLFKRGGGVNNENSGPRLELIGTPEAIARAKKDIPVLAANAEVTETFAILGACSGNAKLADAVTSSLMRDRAAKLNQIGKETGTNLTMLGGSGKGGGRSPPNTQSGNRREIRITGSKADVVQAKRMLGQLVNDLREATSSTATSEFEIPEDTVRLVIGAKGRTIQRIKAVSGVISIDFEKADDGKSKCRINGKPEAVARAEEMVKAISAGEQVDFTKKVEETQKATAPAFESARSGPRLLKAHPGAKPTGATKKAGKRNQSKASKSEETDDEKFPALSAVTDDKTTPNTEVGA